MSARVSIITTTPPESRSYKKRHVIAGFVVGALTMLLFLAALAEPIRQAPPPYVHTQ